jgi:hypothetical protein
VAEIPEEAMTRSQRSAHRILWTVLALAVAFGFGMALLLRAPADANTREIVSEVRT